MNKIRFILALCLCLLTIQAHAAPVTLPALQVGTSVVDANLFWCRQAAAGDPTKDSKCTASAIKAYIQAAIGKGLSNAGSVLDTTNGLPDTRLSKGIIYASDRGLYVNYAGVGSSILYISSASTSGLTGGWSTTVQSTSTGSVVITPDGGSTVCGNATQTVAAGTGLFMYSDGHNFLCDLSSNALPLAISALPASMLNHTIGSTTDGNGVAITAGDVSTSCRRVQYNGTITGWSMLGDLSGSATVDIWNTSSGSKPTVANTITASAKPSLSSSAVRYSSAVGTWTTSVHAGDYMCFHIDSDTTITRLTTQIFLTITP